jgi:hypothetical protein
MGFRYLFCRHHGCELELPFYAAYCFLNRDYRLFDYGGVAFSEANLKSCLRSVPACHLGSVHYGHIPLLR